jgi:pimeloyl-ACP methyl ester carboxylesterase
MLPSSRGSLIFSRVFAWYFQAIAPLSLTYCTLTTFNLLPFRRLPKALEIWLLAESLFYLLVYLPMSVAVHGPAMKVSVGDRTERRDLFNKCIATITDPVRYMSLWHRGAPIETIGRENVKEWICWGFMDRSTWEPDEDEELEEYVDTLENLLPDGMKFRQGKTPGIKALRFSLDPVNISHKPLLFYILGVGGADIYAALVMWYHGYQHYATKQWFASFPFRPQTLLSQNKSPAKHVSYWYRPHTSKTKLPILYIHGIGILHTYGDFFTELAARIDADASHGDGQIGIIVLEILPISFRMTHAALTPADMRSEIQAILDQHAWSRFVLIANSYGSIISVQLLRSPSLNARIVDVMLIDPVAFLLHLPDMVYNFTRRPPQSASEHQLYYFASTDIGAAHTLARRLSWPESILWKEDLKGRRWTIMLSEIDIIVAAEQIGMYLTRPEGVKALDDHREGREWKTTKWTAGELDVIWLEGLNHAEVFDTERDRKMVIDIAMNYSGGESREVEERPEGYGRWVEKSLLYKASPARFASSFGLDKTLDWEAEQAKGRRGSEANGFLPKRRSS